MLNSAKIDISLEIIVVVVVVVIIVAEFSRWASDKKRPFIPVVLCIVISSYRWHHLLSFREKKKE